MCHAVPRSSVKYSLRRVRIMHLVCCVGDSVCAASHLLYVLPCRVAAGPRNTRWDAHQKETRNAFACQALQRDVWRATKNKIDSVFFFLNCWSHHRGNPKRAFWCIWELFWRATSDVDEIILSCKDVDRQDTEKLPSNHGKRRKVVNNDGDVTTGGVADPEQFAERLPGLPLARTLGPRIPVSEQDKPDSSKFTESIENSCIFKPSAWAPFKTAFPTS